MFAQMEHCGRLAVPQFGEPVLLSWVSHPKAKDDTKGYLAKRGSDQIPCLMRILSVDIANPSQFVGGLHPVQMDRLQNCVVIAGRNGSGKSRLLRVIEQAIPQVPFTTSDSEFD